MEFGEEKPSRQEIKPSPAWLIYAYEQLLVPLLESVGRKNKKRKRKSKMKKQKRK
jgi:hypothetical protein